jgi:hypothetical protein
MPQENLLSLQQKFNNLGPDQGKNVPSSAMTDRYGNPKWDKPNQFKKRSNSNIGKGSRLAYNTLTPSANRRPRMDNSIDIA